MTGNWSGEKLRSRNFKSLDLNVLAPSFCFRQQKGSYSSVNALTVNWKTWQPDINHRQIKHRRNTDIKINKLLKSDVIINANQHE